MEKYSVCLFPRFAYNVLPLVADDLEAEYPYEAIYALLRQHHLKKVQHAAVQLPSGSILRYDDVELPADEQNEA